MPKDGGFERQLVKQINKTNTALYAYRRKQSRFSSQDIDLLIDSSNSKTYAAIECKSKKIKNNSSKLYFSQAFSVNKDGEHQLDRQKKFLEKTGRDGYLAISYRRGRGRKVQWRIIEFGYLYQKYLSEECKGLTKKEIEEHGADLKTSEGLVYLV